MHLFGAEGVDDATLVLGAAAVGEDEEFGGVDVDVADMNELKNNQKPQRK
jgi:hypothetical protein